MTDVRNLVVGCDGTWNDPDQADDGTAGKTNVVKFMEAMASLGGRQVPHYEEGVGTRAWEALPGGIYGYGLDKRILGSYRFLRKRFADRDWPRDRNKVFLLGFSRGAYTVRRLAGLISHSGLPVKSTDSELGWEMYRQRDTKSAARLKRDGRFFDVPIEMIGVWDTVKATNDEDYHDADLGPNVAAGYHAMAIDERRRLFPVLKWKKDVRCRQVWFAGVHSDVGGGYASAGLADIALRWMIDRALAHGLQFKANYVKANVKPSHLGRLHESFEGIYVPLGQKRRSIAKSDPVHVSVQKRMKTRPTYRPPNLPADPSWTTDGT
jgi:uncharacterized protein (DUF2235 family)